MKEKLFQLNQQLYPLSVFRKVLETPVVSSLQKLLRAIEAGSVEEQLSCYGTFSHVLFEHGGNLTAYMREAVLDCENPYLQAKLTGTPASPALEAKSEGYILGVGAKIFTIAGPVILYGTLASFICGILYYMIGLA